jgi:HEAT repeat protein
MLSGKDSSGASQAVWALSSNGTAEAKHLLERALDSKEPSVRMAAISSMSNTPDDRSTDLLLRMTRDSDPGVRSQALSTLGQIGSERAQAAVIDATRSGKTEDRVAAIGGLASMDDAKASQQLASLIRDRDPDVARAAIGSSYNAGPEVDRALTQMIDDASVKDDLKAYAATQLRSRGVDLDERTEQLVTKLVGTADQYGGYGYGGYARYSGGEDIYE